MSNLPIDNEQENMAADLLSAVTSLTHKGVRDPKAISLIEGVRKKLIQQSFKTEP